MEKDKSLNISRVHPNGKGFLRLDISTQLSVRGPVVTAICETGSKYQQLKIVLFSCFQKTIFTFDNIDSYFILINYGISVPKKNL